LTSGELEQGIGMTSERTRDRMLERLGDQGIRDMRVLMAMRQVPRHLFVEDALAHRAYEDTALPIAAGQTISQPYTVARMTELLLEKPMQKVLEVGTGSGYQAAVLAQLMADVFTSERIHSLYLQTRKLLADLGYGNIHCRYSDGELAWRREAPFDGILVTAAPEVFPQALLQMVREGGQIIVPVGGYRKAQELMRIERTAEGYTQEVIEEVEFVPMLKGAV
jgi:protein-L-isoaspartate(D-aspartate) O-methyltransferase